MTRRWFNGLTLLLAFAAAGVAIAGCKAKEAKSTGFTTAQMMDKNPELPFHKSWRKPGVDFNKFHKLYVAPVNTEYMLKHTDWQKGERRKEIEADVAELAKFAKETVEKDFREDLHHRYEVLSVPNKDSDTLVLEIAITEVVPSKVVLNALGYVPFGIGLSITAVRTVAGDESSAAFEARVSDASTNEIIAMVADRESQQFAPISVRGLTWYSHSKTMVQQWSRQFVQIANRKPHETIKDTDTFTLKPW
jgi:hypothetical protein